MVCERCNEREATLHITKTTAAHANTSNHFCTRCAEELGATPNSLPSFISAALRKNSDDLVIYGRIVEIYNDALVLHVLESSSFKPGELVTIRRSQFRRPPYSIGEEIGIGLSQDEISSTIINPSI